MQGQWVFSHNNWLDGEVMGLRITWCVWNLSSQINKKTFDATVSWEVRIETALWVALLILKLVDGVDLTFIELVIWHQWTMQAFLLFLHPTPSLSCLCSWICECLINESLLMLYYILLLCSGGDCSLKFKNLMTEISKSPTLSTIPSRMSDGHIKT